MAHYFLDSSALVKRYRDESGSPFVVRLIDSSERLVVSRLAHVEVISTIVRRAAEPGGNRESAPEIIAEFEREMRETFEVIELDATTVTRAIEVARSYALQGADAIQLACALLANPDPADAEYFLVSADGELNGAALSAGLRVLDPVTNA